MADIAGENRYCQSDGVGYFGHIMLNAYVGESIIGKSETDEPCLGDCNNIYQNKVKSRSVDTLAALFENKKPGQSKGGNHAGDIGQNNGS